jgi:hypothetical protein
MSRRDGGGGRQEDADGGCKSGHAVSLACMR